MYNLIANLNVKENIEVGAYLSDNALDIDDLLHTLKLIEDVNKKYGNTIIMVTHNEAIKNMADHVIKLRDGAVRHNDINTNKISADELEW